MYYTSLRHVRKHNYNKLLVNINYVADCDNRKIYYTCRQYECQNYFRIFSVIDLRGVPRRTSSPFSQHIRQLGSIQLLIYTYHYKIQIIDHLASEEKNAPRHTKKIKKNNTKNVRYIIMMIASTIKTRDVFVY